MPDKEPTWDDDFADLLERIMACAVVGEDPAPLKAELKALIAQTDEVSSADITKIKELIKDGKL
jgi:hypothetical protein